MPTTFPTENPGQPAAFVNSGGATTGTAREIARAQGDVGELEKALVSIRQARDTLISRNLELSSKLAIATDRISELEDEREAAEHARDASLQLAHDVSRQGDELRGILQVLTEENSRLQIAEREAGQTALVGRANNEASALENFSEIEELRRKFADLEATNFATGAQHAKCVASLQSELTAAQRARDIAVGAIVDAQRQIERLTSDGKSLRARIEAEQAMFNARILQLESQISESVPKSTEPGDEVPSVAGSLKTVASLENGDLQRQAEAIQACVHAFSTDHGNAAILAELDERFRGFAASAGGQGCSGIARYSSACGELTRWLCKTPRKIEETLQSLIDAAALLVKISAEGRPDQIADLAGAMVFTVDDDGDNCECIAMSLEKSALRTKYSLKSESALAELRNLNCELITLDVDLPDMNGFELFERIRGMVNHRDTPVIFLSGLMSTRDRMESLPGSNQAFIAKPYNLNELGVIVLGMILKARLVKHVPPTAAMVTIV